MGYDKKHLGDLLRRVFASVRQGTVDPNAVRRVKVLAGSGTQIQFSGPTTSFKGVVPEGQGPTLTIIDDGVDAIDEFVLELQKDDEFRDIIGSDAICKALDALLRSTAGEMPSDDLASIVRFRIIKPLRDSIREWETYVPIVNLIAEERLALGNVEFISPHESKDALNQFVCGDGVVSEADDKRKRKESIRAKCDEVFRQSQCFARVTLWAHEERVQSVGADIALVAINVLRAHTHLFYGHNGRALIGLPVELPIGTWQTIAIDNTEKRDVRWKSSRIGPLREFVLDSAMLSHLRGKCHFGVVEEILAKDAQKRNSLESAIIQAFQSVGRAVVAPTVDMRFLGFTIALERMLIVDGEDTTTERWSDRLALVVAADASHRDAVIRRAKQLYDLRSRIVHAAFSGVPDEDAQLMEQWALHSIFVALSVCRQCSSHREFCDTIDPRKLGLGIDQTSRLQDRTVH